LSNVNRVKWKFISTRYWVIRLSVLYYNTLRLWYSFLSLPC